MKSKYLPIDCSYYDRLEAWATTRKVVQIQYMPENELLQVNDVIIDFYIENGAEFLKLKSGHSIRLDYLISVDGIALPKSC